MAFLGDEKNLTYELILALVSLWLLVDSIKKGKSQTKRPIDFFFLIYFTKDIFLLLYYYFASFWFSTWLRHDQMVGFHFNNN